MDGIIRSEHFEYRFQQRGLTELGVETLLQYGSSRRTRDGARSLTFTKDVLAEIRADLGDRAFKACDRLKNAYIVLSDEGTAITVARSYRKVTHRDRMR